MGGLPLRTPTHRRYGGPLPRRLPNAPHAHPCPDIPFLPKGCPSGIYAGLARLSAGCPPDRGRLHTCYSPVRRSPAEKASFLPAAPRLACVKPAASVHPEPGSNSPLFYVSVLRRISRIVRPGLPVLSRAPAKPAPRRDGAEAPLLPLSCGIAVNVLGHPGEPRPPSQAGPVPVLRVQSYDLSPEHANFPRTFSELFCCDTVKTLSDTYLTVC